MFTSILPRVPAASLTNWIAWANRVANVEQAVFGATCLAAYANTHTTAEEMVPWD